jgi:hypothetical protein
MGLYETPLGGWEAFSGGKPPSYQIEEYRDSLTQGLPGGIQKDLAFFEKRMNAGQANVKWHYGYQELGLELILSRRTR